MVGVLRSKACNACRARRKKCDEQRPVCGACSKRGAKCVYRKDIHFVFFQPPSNNVSDSASETTEDFTSPETEPNAVVQHAPPFFDFSQVTPFDLPPTVLLTADSARAHGFFLDRYLPASSKSRPLTGVASTFASSAWYKTAGQLASSDPLLSDALMALSFKSVEQTFDDPDAALQARLVYGRVVKNITQRLGNPLESTSDSTLAAVMALTTWETQSATSNGALGWLAHVRGAMLLVQLRGSANFDTEFGKELYLGSLLSNLIGAIGDRKALPPRPTSGTSPAYTLLSGEFASYAKLFHILYDLPAILEQGDKVTFAVENKMSRTEVIAKMSVMTYLVRDFESRLSEWTTQLDETPDDPLFWQEPSILSARLPASSPDRVFTYFYCFRSLDIGHQLVFSWAFHLLANLALATTVKDLKEEGYSDVFTYATDADMTTIFQKLYKLSTDILVSLEFFLLPDMGQTGIDFLGLPVNLVYGFLKPREFPEVRWFNVLFQRMYEVSSGFGSFIKSMAEQGGGGRAFKLLMQKNTRAPMVVVKSYSDSGKMIPHA